VTAVKKRQNAEVRKPDIVRNFYQVILEEGIEGASIGKVAKRMNIHPSLIIHYFQNRENLLIALVDHVIHEAGVIYQKLIIRTDDPSRRLRNLIEVFFSDEWYHMSDIGTDFSILSLACRDDGAKTRIRNMYGLLERLIIREIEPVIEAGIIKYKDSKRVAEIIITMYEGYRHFKHFYVDNGDAGDFREDMLESVVAALIKQ
jgi:AcrR family transcriptional regulator